MPELPEVEFCRRALSRWTAGADTARFEIHDPRVVRDSRTARPSAGSAQAADRLRALGGPGPIHRHGKRLLWEFSNGALLLHLGMTGRWTRLPCPFPKVTLHVPSGPITFNDPRLLGGLVPFDDLAGAHAALHHDLGPDALAEPLPPLPGARAVKLVLMDQAVIAGVGNVQAMEALWRAGIHPLQPAFSLTTDQHQRLGRALRVQLLATLDLLGDGDEITYVEERGAPNPFPLYQRDGQPCPVCTTPIAHFRQAGRGTWWCPTCQPPG